MFVRFEGAINPARRKRSIRSNARSGVPPFPSREHAIDQASPRSNAGFRSTRASVAFSRPSVRPSVPISTTRSDSAGRPIDESIEGSIDRRSIEGV
jgi:hypothetical protein